MNPVEETPLKQIRTFQGDVAEALRKQRESLVSIQQAEHLKRSPVLSADTSLENSLGKKKESFLLFLGSLALFALGIVGVWYAYNEFVNKTTTPVIMTPANRLISVDAEINLDLTVTSREMLIETLSKTIDEMPRGELRHINIALSTSEFLNALESRAPGSLIRAFDPLFMFGTFKEGVFLIIKLVSFENAFAGMLAWEKNLATDIGPLFATARLLKDIRPESVFTDITDRNKDIRVLALGEKPVLFYSFFDNNILIITDSIGSLRTLIDRLTREKLSR